MSTIHKVTPILYVESIEPCLPFWTDRLGFTLFDTVPEGDALGFAILGRDGVEIMYQTRRSVEADVPAVAAGTPLGGSILFIRVADIDAIEHALDGVPLLVPRRKTFYGADELFVKEPGGHTIGFAQFAEPAG
jgi:catechol 2,3-dioxygenase-like lactoylglutathione lyase family enzyme